MSCKKNPSVNCDLKDTPLDCKGQTMDSWTMDFPLRPSSWLWNPYFSYLQNSYTLYPSQVVDLLLFCQWRRLPIKNHSYGGFIDQGSSFRPFPQDTCIFKHHENKFWVVKCKIKVHNFVTRTLSPVPLCPSWQKVPVWATGIENPEIFCSKPRSKSHRVRVYS